MPLLSELRAVLALTPPGQDGFLDSLDHAVQHCPEVPPRQVIHAVSTLAAASVRHGQTSADLSLLLQALRIAAMDARPE